MSPTKNPNGRKRNPAREAVEEETPRSKILRTAHAHRSRAHTSSVGRRRQARRDAKYTQAHDA